MGNNFVIPGQGKALNPEPITTVVPDEAAKALSNLVECSGYGFQAPLRGPGMTAEGSLERRFHVYLLASDYYGTLYLGMTSDLAKRVYQHKEHSFPGFSARYGVDRLVWYEEYPTALEAIEREKKLKKWRRDWKIRLIEEMNPDWSDLYATLA